MRSLLVVSSLLLLASAAAAQAQPEATEVTILRGTGAAPTPVVQQQTVVVQPTTVVSYPIVTYPYVPAATPFYFFPVSVLLHHRHR